MADAITCPARYEVVRVAYDSKGNALCKEDEQAEHGHVDVVYEPRLFETFRTRGTKKEAILACRRHRDAILEDQRAQDVADGAAVDERLPPTGSECCDRATRYWRAQYQAEANENTAIRKALGIETDDPDQTITAAAVQERLDAAEKRADSQAVLVETWIGHHDAVVAKLRLAEKRAEEAIEEMDTACDGCAHEARANRLAAALQALLLHSAIQSEDVCHVCDEMLTCDDPNESVGHTLSCPVAHAEETLSELAQRK
jgi:hypothetical protein